jgi:hypothetical protein
MHPAYQRLVARVKPLGNPARKPLRAVERYGEALFARLEAAGTLADVHLDRAAPAPVEDFERVAAAGRDFDEKLVLLGTFYCVQYLHQNARALEQLAVDLAEDPDRLRSYAAFLQRAAEQFSLLNTTYIQHVLRIVGPAGAGPYALLSVGTRGHQDDVDIAVVDLGGSDRAEVDRAIGRLAGQCLRFASPLDNYLAGEVGAKAHCVSIEELSLALRSGKLGCVVVTGLLRAELLAGDEELFRRLADETTAEYFFRPRGHNLRHELYLRGLLGEIRSLLLRPLASDRVNPKDDGLRLILGLVTSFRVIEGVGTAPREDLFDDLIAWRPQMARPLARLKRAWLFLEAFRLLTQLLIAQEEDLAVEGETAERSLAVLASAMGYRDRGPVRAVSHLLVHYRESLEAARLAASLLMTEVTRHLREHGPFSRWAAAAPRGNVAKELAEKLAEASRAFRGVRFYDDLLEVFSAPRGPHLDAFVLSFTELPASERRELCSAYAAWGCEAPYALLTLVTLLAARRGRNRSVDVANEIADAYIARLSALPEAVRALSRVFLVYPGLVNRFLLGMGSERLDRLHSATQVPIGSPEGAAARDRFQALIRVHRHSSHYILRVLGRVTERHPAIVDALPDDAALRTAALGRLAASERYPSPEEQKGLLGDFYDIEFLRIAMGTLRGEPDYRARTGFFELTTTYLDRLFDFCFREADHEARGRLPQRDRMGIFLAGGNARRRPYDEDYDLIALIDSRVEEEQRFAERVVALMNRQIARRGVVAQYRLAEHHGRFVTSLDELVALLSGDSDDLFVDRCQLLGARKVVGSRGIEARLESRVLGPFVFDQADRFAARVAREIEERRRTFHPMPKGMVHLKDTPGGLREIDLSLAIARARLRFWEPAAVDPFAALARLDPSRASIYEGLAEVYDFLIALRSAYRVTVVAADEIERARLDAPARIIGYEGSGMDRAHRLFADLEERMANAASLVDELARGGNARSGVAVTRGPRDGRIATSGRVLLRIIRWSLVSA